VSAVPEGFTPADVVVWGEGSTLAQQIAVGSHRLTGDEPEGVGGSDIGPFRYDFLLAALGSCTSDENDSGRSAFNSNLCRF
jgi:uncharacterized OsmC-like protein